MIGPGVHKIGHDEYHADPCEQPSLSRGIIHILLSECERKAFMAHPRLNPDYQEDNGDGKFDKGSAAHSLLLEGFDSVVIVEANDWRTNAAKDKREEAWAAGKQALLTHQFDEVNKMVAAAQVQIAACKELQIDNLRKEGDSELSYIWMEKDYKDRITYLRTRKDWISKDRKLILDYKTTAMSANPDSFVRQIVSGGYDIQDALYRRGVKTLEGIDAKFVFVVQETEAPYLCSFISLPPEFQEMGKQKVEYGIYLWNKCMESGNWPAYPNRICYPDCPPWALAQWEQKAASLGE